MTQRIRPDFKPPALPETRPAKSPALPRGEESVRPAVSQPLPSPPSLALAPWGSAAGAELYRRVQALPEGGTTGSPEATPKDPKKAQEQGVGRTVDRYA